MKKGKVINRFMIINIGGFAGSCQAMSEALHDKRLTYEACGLYTIILETLRVHSSGVALNTIYDRQPNITNIGKARIIDSLFLLEKLGYVGFILETNSDNDETVEEFWKAEINSLG